MELLSSPSSPFVRKVKVLAIEAGLYDKITDTRVFLSPINPSDAVNLSNPLGKIPSMNMEDGTTIFDSRVICEYLDTLHATKKLFPTDPDLRWEALTNQSLGDGIMDSGVLLRFDIAVKPEEWRWPTWYDAQQNKILRTLDELERKAPSFVNLDIGTISIACALGYLDFRFSELISWRTDRPRLTGWYSEFAARKSMQGTVPSD